MEVRHVKPVFPYLALVKGDLYALIGGVTSTLEMAGQVDRAKEFVHRSMSIDSYDELLEVSREYVELGTGDLNNVSINESETGSAS